MKTWLIQWSDDRSTELKVDCGRFVRAHKENKRIQILL